jgi:DNA-binding transcriptional MocR family regulator
MQTMIQAICNYFPSETRVTQPEGGHVLWSELPPEFDNEDFSYQPRNKFLGGFKD